MRTLIQLVLLVLVAALAAPLEARGATNPSKRVPMVATPISRADMADALLEGYIADFDAVPSASRLAMGWAQVALENGHGRFSYDHNLGNIGPSSPEQTYYLSRLDGVFYRAFDSFEDAAAAYWRVVARCQGTLQAFDYGAASVAAARLRACNYFGADLREYTRVMASLYGVGLPQARGALERRATRLAESQETAADEWLQMGDDD